MDLYCIKFQKFTDSNDTEIKHEIDRKTNIYYYCIDSAYEIMKDFILININRNLNDVLKSLN